MTGADVVWLDELAPLLSTCLGTIAGPETVVLLAHQVLPHKELSVCLPACLHMSPHIIVNELFS